MSLPPWYKVVAPRAEVREGRSFKPDEFAIHLEQVVAGKAPDDYRDPVQFFARTCFTRALRDHGGRVLRRLAGKTANTSPVMTLVTQFGGGKTHTLNALYHLATSGTKLLDDDGVRGMLAEAELAQAPAAKVAVFVGTAWDPQEHRETPWIDLARQLAGDAGVRALGTKASTTPPGTTALGHVFAEANGPVLILFDEVLNFMNRHRNMAEQFHAFIQNLTVAMTATTRGAAVISLPRSAVEMTEDDMLWQEKITKIVKRVAENLVANDEREIGEVVRRRLFDPVSDKQTLKKISRTYADWCLDHRTALPPTAVSSDGKDTQVREVLRERFEACYPFHPATLAVFQHKWQALPQYQQTRGTLAMLAQWIAWAYKDGFKKARNEPLITLGSAPLDVPDFHGMVLGQLGESRLNAAINADIAGDRAHARALDEDTKGVLRDIHRRVGTTIFFESSGGQVENVAHLPELRFALGEPELDTTSVDSAARLLEEKAYFLRKVGSDGFKISYQPTLKKVVNDRRASLDEETVKSVMQDVVRKECNKHADVPLVLFPDDGAAIQDLPKLMLVVASPELDWDGGESLRNQILEWTRMRGNSSRLYPGALVWCLKKPGLDLRMKVEQWLAWKSVSLEVKDGSLGTEITSEDREELKFKTLEAEDAARNAVWASYSYAILLQRQKHEQNTLKVIDLGVGHSSASESFCRRVLTALRSEGLLENGVGGGYLERNWPEVFRQSGAWPLDGLRKSFMDGSLTRLVNPDHVLRPKIRELVTRGEFGLGAVAKEDGQYEILWYKQDVDPDDIVFEPAMFLLKRDTAAALRKKAEAEQHHAPDAAESSDAPGGPATTVADSGALPTPPEDRPGTTTTPVAAAHTEKKNIRLVGAVQPEVWNKLGTRLIPILRKGEGVNFNVDLSTSIRATDAAHLVSELKQTLTDLGLKDKVRVEDS